MKIECFEKFLGNKSVSFYKIVETEMDLSKALMLNVSTSSILGNNNIVFNFGLDSDDSGSPVYNRYGLGRLSRFLESDENELKKIPLKINGKTKIYKGILIYENERELSEFLSKYLDAKKDECSITGFFKSCMNTKGKLDKEKIFYKIMEYPLKCIFINKITNDKIIYNLNDNHIVLLNERRLEEQQKIIGAFRKININGYSIPQIDYLYYGISRENKEEEKVIVVYINNEIKVYEALSDINRGIVDYFNKNGRLYSMSYIDLLLDKTRKVFAILKIPTKAEYKKLKKLKKGGSKFKWVLNKPFFVSPCIKPAFFEKNIFIIDDVEIFEHIVTTMSAGIYVPGNIKSEFNIKWLNDKNDFLFLENPV